MEQSSPDALETESMGAGYYLVRGRQGDELVDVRLHLDPGFLDGRGLAQVDESTVVEVTMSYLLQRQRLDELPAALELEDVAAAYDGFEAHLRQRLVPPH